MTVQMNLFDDALEKLELFKAVDNIKNQFGTDAILKATSLPRKNENLP
jgi:DNA polymerase IV